MVWNYLLGGQNYSEALGASNYANALRGTQLGEQFTLLDREFQQGNIETDRYNEIRMNMINEELTRRGTSLNEMNAVISGQQVNPAVMGPVNLAGRPQTTDYLGAADSQYQGDINSFNAQQGGLQGLLSGGASLAGFFSDRRLKRLIQRIGEFRGYPLYVFRYVWGVTSIGVMSDEVNSDAVFKHPSGYDMVDYGRVR